MIFLGQPVTHVGDSGNWNPVDYVLSLLSLQWVVAFATSTLIKQFK